MSDPLDRARLTALETTERMKRLIDALNLTKGQARVFASLDEMEELARGYLAILASRDDLAGQVARLTEERDELRAELMTDRGTEIIRASVAEKLKDRAEASVTTLRGEVARLTQALEKVEWGAESHYGEAQCPACFELRICGHDATCGLSAALRGATEERTT